jgi:hypothetical protein
MKKFIDGYYCRDDLHLQVMNKDSNRKILETLRKAYPDGLTVEELAKKTKLPIKTIYAQKAELYREYYINHLEEQEGEDKPRRGRPSAASRSREEARRKRVRIVIEDASGYHDPYESKKPTPLPPGNVIFSDGFTEAWDNIVGREQQEILCNELLRFISRIFNITDELTSGKEDRKMVKNWIPERTLEFCCTQCGLNHEVRDFIRAMLIHLIDKLEQYDKFFDFLKENQMLTQEAYEQVKKRIRTKK